MLASLKYHGLDLPVFEGQEVFNMDQFKTNKKNHKTIPPGQTSFLRVCGIDAPNFDSLEEVLTTCDDEFAALTDRAGIQLVDYEWGFYPKSETRVRPRIHLDGRLLPDEMLLVANVKTVVDTAEPPLGPRISDLTIALDVHPFNLLDVSLLQTIYGTPRGQAKPAKDFYYVDIEPRLFKP